VRLDFQKELFYFGGGGGVQVNGFFFFVLHLTCGRRRGRGVAGQQVTGFELSGHVAGKKTETEINLAAPFHEWRLTRSQVTGVKPQVRGLTKSSCGIETW